MNQTLVESKDKHWGTAIPILNPVPGRNRLVTHADMSGGKCSLHRHKRCWNFFLVLSGCVDIEWIDRGEVKVQRLGAISESLTFKTVYAFTVMPGVIHRFYVVEPGDMLEVYWTDDGTEPSLEDIERLEDGSPQC